MRVGQRFLPASPPLPFSALLPGRAHALSTFPVNAPVTRWYLLARYALWHGLRSLHLDEGDEVLIPAYNSGAEVGTVIAAGLSPRFFRVHLDLTSNLRGLQSAVSSRTRALLVIHFFGFPQPLGELSAFCARHGLLLIEDCAVALFSRQGSVPLGSRGVFGIFSPHKTLPLPHGGLLVINDEEIEPPPEVEPPYSEGVEALPRLLLEGLEMRHPEIAQLVRRRAQQQPGDGEHRNLPTRLVDSERFQPEDADIGASSLVQRLVQRADPAYVVRERRTNYRLLASLLPREAQVLPDLPEGVCPLFLPYLVADKRAALRTLAAKGIDLYPYWSSPHPAIPPGAFPEADYLRAHLLALPVYQGLSREDVEYLARAVAAVPSPTPFPPAAPRPW